jgi:hypothetical protein
MGAPKRTYFEQLSLSRVSENGTSIAVISSEGGAITQLLFNALKIISQSGLTKP